MSKTTYESLDNKIAASTLTKDLTKGLDVVDGHGIRSRVSMRTRTSCMTC